MRRWLFAALWLILPCICAVGHAQAPTAAGPQQGEPQRVQLTQEHVQILQQIVQQMPEEQRKALAELPPEQRQQVLLQILARVLQPQQKKEVKEWLQEAQNKPITFEAADRYPDAAERIEEFIRKETDRQVKVTAFAFLRDGHDHFFTYKRLYRVKYKTVKDDKEYMADFLFTKEGPYLTVKEWRRVPEATAEKTEG